jgi:tRNA (mo5U34)-methyltransferase
MNDGPVAGHETEREALERAVEGREWYHTLELVPGVTTSGWFDCRTVASRVLPPSCRGMRCLDIGTFDGFWAFSMESRGAEEVVAIDILDETRWDWPARTDAASRQAIDRRKGQGDGFVIARDALGSKVQRVDASIYDLDPATHGRFDLVYLGSLLLHLRDPVGALERVRGVCSGRLVVADAVSLPLSLFVPTAVANLDADGRPYWWKPNTRALRRMLEAGGFEVVSGPSLFFMPIGRGFHRVRATPRNLLRRQARELAFASRFGEPHAVAVATPR